jgi:hypothetical protein
VPISEASETIRRIVILLTGLVVFAPDDQNIGVGFRLQTDVMIGIERIPVECSRHGVAWHTQSDDVGAIRGLLGMHRHVIVHRRVGRDDD